MDKLERFIYDPECRFYLPLKRLDGNSFMSKDARGHLCTRSGALWGPDGWYFDGADDKIDCGSDFIGTSACTVIAVIKPTGWGESDVGRIITNGKFQFNVRGSGGDNCLFSASDGGASGDVHSALGSVTLNQTICAAVTRTTTGVGNIFINGNRSGAADQAGGTPANGTTNCVIGNSDATDRSYQGYIKMVMAFTRILTPHEIREISNECMY